MQAVVTQHRTVAVDTSAAPVIAVVADTHSRPHPKVEAWLRRDKPAAILHAGDIGAHRVIDALEGLADTYVVRGNIDTRTPRTPDVLVLDIEGEGCPAFRILMTHIAVYGPKLRKDVRLLAQQHKADMVVCGHSHVPLIARDKGVFVFNPGSVGPRRFQLPITYGVMTLGDKGWTLRHVDCETGQTWTPGTHPAGQ